MVIIGRIIIMKTALKWAVHVDLPLHFSEHDGNRGVLQITVLLPLVVLVCCRTGISSNHTRPVVLRLLRKIVEHGGVLSLLAHDGDVIHNIEVSEDLIWSPVASPWCPEYILQQAQNCPQ